MTAFRGTALYSLCHMFPINNSISSSQPHRNALIFQMRLREGQETHHPVGHQYGPHPYPDATDSRMETTPPTAVGFRDSVAR